MNVRPSFALLLFVAAVGSGAAVACSGELNPQPLPPVNGDDDDSPSQSTSSGGKVDNASSSSGGYAAGDPNAVPGAPISHDAGPGADADATADPQ